jgi:hypothetical protein
MSEDRRISAEAAADFLGTPDACQIINQAWKQGFSQLRGVPPGESEPVEIPATEDGRVKCKKSRVMIGRLCTTYLNVTIAWPDVERLAHADVERLLRAAAPESPAPDAPQTEDASNADILKAKDGWLVRPVESELRRHFPESPPGWKRENLMWFVHNNSGGTIPVFSLATLDRARKRVWPHAKRSRAPKAAKPPR